MGMSTDSAASEQFKRSELKMNIDVGDEWKCIEEMRRLVKQHSLKKLYGLVFYSP